MTKVNTSNEDLIGFEANQAKFETLLKISKLTLIGATLWGASFAVLGLYIESLFPFIFCLILGLFLYLRGKIITDNQLKYVYVSLIFILPISLQVVMGGIQESGFMAIWSILSPMAALLCLRYRNAVRIFIFFVVSLVIIISIEFLLLKNEPTNDTKAIETFLLVVNILAVTVICFLSLSFFTGQIIRSKNKLTLKDESLNMGLDYAKTVQVSLINSNIEHLQKHLNFFIYCKPKQVVCGDFFWSNTKDGIIHIAVADCYGHGVPAAFLSILGSTILNEIIITQNTQDPSEILEQLNTNLRKRQNPNSRKSQERLIDMTILRIDMEAKRIDYSCANSTIFNSEIKSPISEIEQTNISVGAEDNTTYKTESMTYTNGHKLYLTSNGIKNQVNRNNEPLGVDGLSNIINSLGDTPMVSQETKFDYEFNNWRDNTELTDDVLIVGIKF